MELKIFNKENSSLVKTGEATVRINTTAGLISFSKDATQLLGIAKDSKISFAQDSKNKEDWYIFQDAEKGFTVRINTDSSGSDFNSTPLAKEIMMSVDKSFIAAGFKISKTSIEHEGKNYFLLITASPLNPKKQPI